MSFPPSFLEELRSRLPLSEVAAKRIRLTRAGREYKACCPFHHEKTPSFYINDDKRFYHCFGCGAHGDIIGFVMHYDRLSFPEAIESLASLAGLAVPQDTPQERERYDQEKRLYLLMEKTTAWFEEQLFATSGREALHYLQGRGLTEEGMRRFHLGFAPQDAQLLIRRMTSEGFTPDEMLQVGLVKKAPDRPDHYSFFRNRVMFPVGDSRGRTVAFGGRVMGEGEPKYLNSPDHPLFHKGKLLYGLSRARQALSQGQPIIVVEGYMDVIALVENGYLGAVAPLGTALTEDQLMLLWKLLPPLDARDPSRDYSPILCFDGDGAGLKAAVRGVARALPLLTATQTVRVAYLPEGEDPDSLLKQSGKSGMQPVVDQAKNMIDVLWEQTIASRRLQTPEDRSAFTQALREKIKAIRDESLRRLYGEEIKNRLDALFERNKTVERAPAKAGFSKRVPPSGPIIARKGIGNPERIKEKLMLAVMINHPELFGEFGEEWLRISFVNADLEALRRHLVDLYAETEHDPLDAAALYRHLSGDAEQKKLEASLNDLLSDRTYVYGLFARPDRSTEEARKGWKSIWNKHLLERYQVDFEAAKKLYMEDPSDVNRVRFETLREQVRLLTDESVGRDELD
jgi:DNA primase